MCLLDILQKSGYPLIVAHLDHQIRPSSAADAKFVRQQAADRGLRCVDRALDVPGYATEHKRSLEEAARKLRYQFLFNTAGKVSAQGVAVGHTADDQVETVLMHMIQGAGLKGLRGMAFRVTLSSFSEEIPIVRPLLSEWRADILKYCEQNGLQTIEDPSNLDEDFTRNRVRQKLIPLLETFNPAVREAVWRMSQVLAGDLAVNQVAIDRVWDLSLQAVGPGVLVFRRPVWVELGEGFQRSLMRRALEEIDPTGLGPGFNLIEEALDFIRLQRKSRREKRFGDIRLVVDAGDLWFLSPSGVLPEDNFPRLQKGASYQVKTPGSIDLPGGWRLSARWVDDISAARVQAKANRDPYQAWVDAGVLDNRTLVLRTRQPGDRLKPLGLGGRSQKLSDLFVNEKMPARARELWPLVVVDNDLVWVPGYRLGDPFRLTPQTVQVIYLSLEKGGG
jgi:tRNA(Ile)-lysidine synthase